MEANKEILEKIQNLNDKEHEIYIKLGAKIKNYRILKNLTKNKLSLITGLSVKQIEDYEVGENKISLINLMKISIATSVGYTNFLNGLLTKTNNFPSLTNDELELIINYRKTSDEKRKLLKDIMSEFK